MVSNSLGIPLDELIERLRRFGRDYAEDPEYVEVRAALPPEFPF
ncbi:MAG: hypothetical protein VW450_06805 [Chloroflexota bacterium]